MAARIAVPVVVSFCLVSLSVPALAQDAPAADPAPAAPAAEAQPAATTPAETVPTAPAASEEIVPKEIVPTEIVPRAFSEQRRDTLLLDSVVHENAWWGQFDLGLSIYDPRRDVVIARHSPGISVGRRFSYYGVFGAIQFDQSFDFTLDVDTLNVVNIGLGGEYLSFLGHVRSSILVGTSILVSDTLTFEFDPIALDLIVPVTKGIPLVVYSFSSFVGLEWSPK